MEDRHELYEDFQKIFGIERLREMTLDEYTNLDKNSFCYYVEFKLKSLGAVGGKSSQIYGVYRYNKKPSSHLMQKDDKYAWYAKYGVATASEAFAIVKDAVVRMATFASEGNFEAIDEISELGDLLKWKIAFLYSKESLIPIYKRDWLVKSCSHLGMQDAETAKISALQRYLMEQKGDKPLYEFTDELTVYSYTGGSHRIWMYAPGEKACKWDFCLENSTMCIGWDELGDCTQYETRDAIVDKMKAIYGKPNGSFKNDSLAMWNFFKVMQEGDIVFVKNGVKKIIGRGVVESEYYFDEELDEYQNCRKVRWTDTGEWNMTKNLTIKTLTDITKYTDYVKELNEMMGEEPVIAKSEGKYSKYIKLLEQNGNIVLTGAPGTGKTHLAREIAREMGCEEPGFVQFHPSYDYTDFVEGLRPVESGFKRVDGTFKIFCKEALKNLDDSKKNFVFIIDEINRGEISKIFGELFFAIDPGYRGTDGKVTTQYQNLVEKDDVFKQGFFVPENVYIIGTMNDIDRSVEAMDFAIRRRFVWVEVKASDSAGNMNLTEAKKARIERVNELIGKMEELGEAYQLGGAYFLDKKEAMSDDERWEYRIEPLLKEYLRGVADVESKLERLKEAYFKP